MSKKQQDTRKQDFIRKLAEIQFRKRNKKKRPKK